MNSSIRMEIDEPASAASKTAGEEEEEEKDRPVGADGAVPPVSAPAAISAVAAGGKGKKKKPTCSMTSKQSERSEVAGDVRVDGNSSTIYVNPLDKEWKTKPYARYHDPVAMAHVREFTLKPFPTAGAGAPPACTKNHSVSGFLFSNGPCSGQHGTAGHRAGPGLAGGEVVPAGHDGLVRPCQHGQATA